MPPQIQQEYLANVRQSPNKPQLWGGMERVFMIVIGYICAQTIIALMDRYGLFLAVSIGSGLSLLGRICARYDPRMTDVYFGSLDYEDSYPAIPQQACLVRVARK